MDKTYITSIIIVLLIVYLSCYYVTKYNESYLLSGFWMADPEFCRSAEIDYFIVYIDEPSYFSTMRKCYVMMANEKGILINNVANISFMNNFNLNCLLPGKKEYKININWCDNETFDFFPLNQTVYFYPDCNKLIFSSDDVITAILYKNNIMSDYKNNAPDNLIDRDEFEEI